MFDLDLQVDLKLIENTQYKRIVGIDEVGRGSWAGPVAVGAYVIDSTTKMLNGINDSKKVKPAKRSELSKELSNDKHSIHLGDLDSINKIGIGKTITNLIGDIVDEYNSDETFFLIDGQFARNFGRNTLKIIRGDAIYYSVAAASILAKVYRDNLMRTLHFEYQNYGFNTNVGYPTFKHLAALKKLGITKLHRTSYKPILKIISKRI